MNQADVLWQKHFQATMIWFILQFIKFRRRKKHFWFVLTLPPNYREGSTSSLVTWTTNEQRCYNGRENTLSETLMGRYQLIKKKYDCNLTLISWTGQTMLILFLKIGKYSTDLHYHAHMVTCTTHLANNKATIEFRIFDVKDAVTYRDMQRIVSRSAVDYYIDIWLPNINKKSWMTMSP